MELLDSLLEKVFIWFGLQGGCGIRDWSFRTLVLLYEKYFCYERNDSGNFEPRGWACAILGVTLFGEGVALVLESKFSFEPPVRHKLDLSSP